MATSKLAVSVLALFGMEVQASATETHILCGKPDQSYAYLLSLEIGKAGGKNSVVGTATKYVNKVAERDKDSVTGSVTVAKNLAHYALTLRHRSQNGRPLGALTFSFLPGEKLSDGVLETGIGSGAVKINLLCEQSTPRK